jgi:hypothetical protein
MRKFSRRSCRIGATSRVADESKQPSLRQLSRPGWKQRALHGAPYLAGQSGAYLENALQGMEEWVASYRRDADGTSRGPAGRCADRCPVRIFRDLGQTSR